MFEDLKLEPRYHGHELGERLIQPLMNRSYAVDALSSYFTLNGLKAISIGLDRLHERKGVFRMVMSLQDAKGSEFVKALRDADELQPLVEEVAALIKEEALTVSDSLARESLATLGWMLRDGLLQIKVAALKAEDGAESARGIFHQKAFVFWGSKERLGDGVSAEGSMNFTENGLEWNSESLLVFKRGESHVHFESTVAYFDKVWLDQDPELIVRDLSKDIAEEIAEVFISLSKVPYKHPVPEIVCLMRQSPEFARYNTSKVALFPHQERALCDALSRTPVRVMFSDDVGLGKTIEAGATLCYGLNHLGWVKVILMVPASLAKQWVGELYDKFGIHAKRLDSDEKRFLDGEGCGCGDPNLPWGHGVFVVSAQLVSRSPAYRDIFVREIQSTDCLMVDEAHSARRRIDISERPVETLIYKLISEISGSVRNLMLLTATPMQSQQEELVALLEQLGLPDRWKQRDFFESYHDLLRKAKYDAEDAVILETGAIATQEVDKRQTHIEPYALATNAGRFRAAVVSSAVTSSIIIRNTRNALKRIGYAFPERHVLPSEIILSPSAQKVYKSIERYLRYDFGITEEVVFGGENAMGFLYTTYFQRIVSSFNSAHSTLSKRREKLQEWLSSDFKNATPFELDDDGADSGQMTRRRLSDNDIKQARICCNRELTSLDPIVDGLAGFAGVNAGQDPKLQRLVSLVRDLITSGESFLIFSRYTDTTDAVVELLSPLFTAAGMGFAYYSGSDCWMNLRGCQDASNKDDVVSSLRSGDVKVVICTDAASEGLNLQAACHLINVDVPWNPARLEQRFGRIDRLGQKAKAVTFYNLWYPGSIEERMYGAILAKGANIGFSVGVMSDTVGKAIRTQLASRNSAAGMDVEASLIEVQALQDKLNLQAIEETSAGKIESDSASSRFRDGLLRLGAFLPGCRLESGFLVNADGDFLTSDLSEPTASPITIFSLPYEHLKVVPVSLESPQLLLLESAGKPICLVHKSGDGSRVMGPLETVNCLECLVSGMPFVLTGTVDFKGESIDRETLERVLFFKFPGRIDSNALDFHAVLGLLRPPTVMQNSVLTLRHIGYAR
jgi:superfamily II DNA or RNA helicase